MSKLPVLMNDLDDAEELLSISDRFVLRPLESSVEVLGMLMAFDDTIERFLGINPATSIVEASERLSSLLSERDHDGPHKWWTVFDLTGGVACGLFHVYEYNYKCHKCSISLALTPEYRGRGLSREVIRRVCDKLEVDNDIHRIEAAVELLNVHAIAICLRCANQLDFTYEGTKINYWGPNSVVKVWSRTF